MTSLPEENTLGAIVGAKSQRREADATRRVIRAATPRRSSLGTGFIGIGAAVVVALDPAIAEEGAEHQRDQAADREDQLGPDESEIGLHWLPPP